MICMIAQIIREPQEEFKISRNHSKPPVPVEVGTKLIMERIRKERILILAKTYPSPSAQYVETSCVAGINEHGAMRRLYPVPFRLIGKDQQFRKWQWIEARIEKANRDHRIESHKVYVDTIMCAEVIDTKNQWEKRWPWIDKVPIFSSFDDLDASRSNEGTTLALLRPKAILEFEITKARNLDWTDEEREKLLREQMQGGLFSEAEVRKEIKELRKIPLDFYYQYVCDTADGEKVFRHKIVDWEAGALYWRCRGSYGNDWEVPFRQMYGEKLLKTDITLMMGNIHQYPHQWLIISVFYPPRKESVEVMQAPLF